MTELDEIIRVEIRTGGPMRFDRFMELALYHPACGYYTQLGQRSRIGRRGDFFTSVSVGPLFGRLLAKQSFQMWQMLGNPRPFWIMEQGAHNGQLASDILEWSRAEVPDFFETIRYAIVEPSAATREVQQTRAEETGRLVCITWFENLDLLAREQPVGIFISNELVDAFPVRVVTFLSGQWQEKCVTIDKNNALSWTTQTIEDRELVEAVKTLPSIEGYTTEINLRGRDWMKDVSHVLKQGYVVTIDYGFPASVYYAAFRMDGTLTAHLNHRRTEEVLVEPGARDLTAHVDFTALARAGEVAGLTTIGFVDQQRFLMGIARDEFSGTLGPRVHIGEGLPAWNTLTHPEYLGTRFQVLLQSKDAPANLDGLQFARPGGLD